MARTRAKIFADGFGLRDLPSGLLPPPVLLSLRSSIAQVEAACSTILLVVALVAALDSTR